MWTGVPMSCRTSFPMLDVGLGTYILRRTYRPSALTAQRYLDDVLEEHVVPYAPYIGPEFRPSLTYIYARMHTHTHTHTHTQHIH